jgi:tetratricopeptide (TPR) repeat protein
MKLLVLGGGGRLGINPRGGGGDVLGDEEVTVSLSKSSSWMSPQASSTRTSSPQIPKSLQEPPLTIEEHDEHEESPDPPFLDAIRSSHNHHIRQEDCSQLDTACIVDEGDDLFLDTLSTDDASPSRRDTLKNAPNDEFMTAYTSQEELSGLDFDHLVVSPSRFSSKVKIKRLTLPPNLCISLVPSATTRSANEVTEREHQCRKEQVFWDTMAASRSKNLGIVHHDTAEAYMSLGHAHLRLNEYDEAMEAFQTSCKIFKALNGPTHLSVGRALDAFGLAALRHHEGGPLYLIQAKTALEEAFAIRFHSLGVWHADTVETFNKIGNVYLYMGRLKEAADAYREVYLVRLAIYGNIHPSVAIIAHGLSNIHFIMSQQEEAQYYFEVASNVYMSMDLSSQHPAMVRLRRDRDRLYGSTS